MGTWGPGHFDSDTAADHLSIITKRLIDDVTEAMHGDPETFTHDEWVGVSVPCTLELLLLIARQQWVGAMVPDREALARWRAALVAAQPDRRAALDATFDQLSALAPTPSIQPSKKKAAKPAKKPAAAKKTAAPKKRR